MLISILVAFIIAKYNKLKVQPIFNCFWLFPFAICEVIFILFQIATVYGYYGFLPYARFLKSAFLYTLLLPIIRYGLYKPSVVGSVLILIGTYMNRIVIIANGGKMPIFPTVSKWTGYFSATPLGVTDTIHCMGNSQTKLKFLADYIDIGYSILSPGDVLVHSFTMIIIYYTLKQLNLATAR
ncbi:MAG: DUF5317 family protein [bacterium]|nr:DUF5317 family protein [bacterium]